MKRRVGSFHVQRQTQSGFRGLFALASSGVFSSFPGSFWSFGLSSSCRWRRWVEMVLLSLATRVFLVSRSWLLIPPGGVVGRPHVPAVRIICGVSSCGSSTSTFAAFSDDGIMRNSNSFHSSVRRSWALLVPSGQRRVVAHS
jgi:hypothetical protein